MDQHSVEARPGDDSSAVGWSALVLAGAAVVATVATAVTIAAFSHDYDEGVYLQSLLSLDAGHPMYSSVFSSQPPLFLFGMLPLFHLAGPSVVAARVTLVLVVLVGLVAVWRLGRRAGRNSGLLAVALMLSVGPWVTSADRLASTVPSVAVSVVGVAIASAAARRSGRARWGLALGAGVVLAVATMIKLLGVVAIVPAGLFLVLPSTARPDADADTDTDTDADGQDAVSAWSWRSGLSAAVALPVGALVGVVAVSAVFWSHGDLYEQVVSFHLQARGVRAGLLFNVKNLSFAVLTIPVFLAALLAIGIVEWRRLRSATIYVAWLVTGGVFLLLQHPLFSPHKLLLVPPAALLVAGLPAWLAQQGAPARVERWGRLAVSAVVVVGLIGLTYDTVTTTRSPGRTTTLMIDALRAHVPASTLVVTDDQVVAAAAGRRVPSPLVDTSNVRFEAGSLTAAELIRVTDAEAGAVLLTGGRFDHVPEFTAWVEQHLDRVATFPGGGALYVKR